MEPTQINVAAGAAAAGQQSADDWLKLSRLHHAQGRFASAISAAESAVRLAPDSADARLQQVESLIAGGHVGDALARLAEFEAAFPHDAARLLLAGEIHARLNRHHDALRCYRQAEAVSPDDRAAALAVARTLTAVGDLADATARLEAITRRWSGNPEAWYALAGMRTWTADDNHVARLEELAGAAAPADLAPYCYALHKELEDQGEDARAMEWLARGARARRTTYQYSVAGDVALMASITRNFGAERLRVAPADGPGAGVIFVIGLPRSGTTLVDRILSAHPAVESLGELRELTFAVMRGGDTAPAVAGQTRPRPDLTAIGRGYLDAVAPLRSGRSHFVDKAPTNFLYAGLVRLALPRARIVLLRRHPMDACLAIHKTLFGDGYPYACDQVELGQYYAAWHALARHWQSTIGDTLLTVDYEALVGDQETWTRRLLEHCGLEWDRRCLEFQRNDSPSATASATQVRRSMYSSSIGRWQRHRSELAALERTLAAAGIAID